jgi:hypothetical protein
MKQTEKLPVDSTLAPENSSCNGCRCLISKPWMLPLCSKIIVNLNLNTHHHTRINLAKWSKPQRANWHHILTKVCLCVEAHSYLKQKAVACKDKICCPFHPHAGVPTFAYNLCTQHNKLMGSKREQFYSLQCSGCCVGLTVRRGCSAFTTMLMLGRKSASYCTHRAATAAIWIPYSQVCQQPSELTVHSTTYVTKPDHIYDTCRETSHNSYKKTVVSVLANPNKDKNDHNPVSVTHKV